jgi:hypothetical protein
MKTAAAAATTPDHCVVHEASAEAAGEPGPRGVLRHIDCDSAAPAAVAMALATEEPSTATAFSMEDVDTAVVHGNVPGESTLPEVLADAARHRVLPADLPPDGTSGVGSVCVSAHPMTDSEKHPMTDSEKLPSMAVSRSIAVTSARRAAVISTLSFPASPSAPPQAHLRIAALVSAPHAGSKHDPAVVAGAPLAFTSSASSPARSVAPQGCADRTDAQDPVAPKADRSIRRVEAAAALLVLLTAGTSDVEAELQDGARPSPHTPGPDIQTAMADSAPPAVPDTALALFHTAPHAPVAAADECAKQPGAHSHSHAWRAHAAAGAGVPTAAVAASRSSPPGPLVPCPQAEESCRAGTSADIPKKAEGGGGYAASVAAGLEAGAAATGAEGENGRTKNSAVVV